MPLSFIIIKTIEHLQLTFLSVLIAMSVSIPLGIFLAGCRKTKVAKFLINTCRLLQSIPPLALMALTFVFLTLINKILRIPVTGLFPGVFVLVVYAFLIILNHTYDIGETRFQSFFKSKPSVFNLIIGIKAAVVSTVAMATLVSLIGIGGLGDLILEGLKNLNIVLIISGALPAAFLGIFFDLLIGYMAKKFI